MPVYECQCPDCDMTAEYLRPVEERLDTPTCPACDVRMEKRIFSSPKGFMRGKFEPFRSTVDGTIIANHRDMVEHNKRNGVECLADGYSNEKVLSGDFGKREMTPITSAKELADDVMSAAIQVRDGYKPTKQVQEDD